MDLNRNWPVLKHYQGEHLRRVAMPLGGIGTGAVSLGGRGDLRDWEIMNRPAKGFTPHQTFFALWAKPAGGAAVTKLLEGPLDPADFEGGSGCTLPNHGLPRFRHCAFDVAYPLAQVRLSDPAVPVDVCIEAFNPLVPADAEASGIPVAVLRFVLRNKTHRRVSAAVCGNLENCIGGSRPVRNVNRLRRSPSGLAGLVMTSQGVCPTAEAWGSMALAFLEPTAFTHRLAWLNLGEREALLDFWDDFSADGRLGLRPHDPRQDNPQGSLAAHVTLAPRAERALTVLLAWHFPNRYTWTPRKTALSTANNTGQTSECGPDDCVGNYYAARYHDAWQVVEATAAELDVLERGTVRFVRAFCSSALPDVVKEAALFNLSTLRTQTVFRTRDGHLFGWEGCNDRGGCCHGSCTHVWNYEQTTPFLFGELAKSMREVEFRYATDDQGRMCFRANLPLDRAAEHGIAAADGQMGCLMKLYRDWQLSGDDGLLRRLWPRARKALEFCWMPGGWDADRDGVMEGCQHNTMDVEYYGPNPQMGAWYLGALRAAEAMARHLGEAEFAVTCARLFARGSRYTDAHLFNGEYYEQRVVPPRRKEDVMDGLAITPYEVEQALAGRPRFQLGRGCLVDQLIGQLAAHVCGLGYLLKPGHVRRTLRSIRKYNFKPDLFDHFNHHRTFALQDEAALVMAAYPYERPAVPFPYYGEVMTGFEYTAAIGMLYEGQVADGLKCIAAIRRRYDGKRRNPFDEAECGHHYARAMIAWAAVLSLTGFHYSGASGTMTFARRDGTHFWSNGYAWGTCAQRRSGREVRVKLRVLGGRLALRRFSLRAWGERAFARARVLAGGETVRLAVAGLAPAGAGRRDGLAGRPTGGGKNPG